MNLAPGRTLALAGDEANDHSPIPLLPLLLLVVMLLL
jgi:hypothetical protein